MKIKEESGEIDDRKIINKKKGRDEKGGGWDTSEGIHRKSVTVSHHKVYTEREILMGKDRKNVSGVSSCGGVRTETHAFESVRRCAICDAGCMPTWGGST